MLKKKVGGGFRHSSRNLKRIARMPEKDRMELLKILKKQARARRPRILTRSTRSKEAALSQPSKASSNTTISFVIKDWEHWFTLWGATKVVAADVSGIGGLI